MPAAGCFEPQEEPAFTALRRVGARNRAQTGLRSAPAPIVIRIVSAMFSSCQLFHSYSFHCDLKGEYRPLPVKRKSQSGSHEFMLTDCAVDERILIGVRQPLRRAPNWQKRQRNTQKDVPAEPWTEGKLSKQAIVVIALRHKVEEMPRSANDTL